MDPSRIQKDLGASRQISPISSLSVPLPDHTQLLFHQIAGHVHGGKNLTELGILKHENGDVLKPLFSDERAVRELEFYKRVFSLCNSDPILSELSTFLPKFKGTWTGQINDRVIKYLCLQDVASAFTRPCNLDVKIGPQTYDPYASEEKKKLEREKFPFGYVVGFRILGMRVYVESEKKYHVIDRSFGKQITPDTVLEGLHNFFHRENGCLVWILLAAFIHRLKTIENWFTKQHCFAFYASSLLFLYEGDRDSWELWFQDVKNSFKCDLRRIISNSRTDHSLSSSAEHESLQNTSFGTSRTGNEKLFFCDVFTVRDLNDCCSDCGLNQIVCKKIISDCQLYDVKMIDFAHLFPSDKEDSNYLFGLRSLISSFQSLLQRLLVASK